jgi:hypothetical protein
MGIDVDRLVVEIPPTAKRCVKRARYGPVTVKDPLVVVVLKPFRHLIEREKSWACLRPGCVVFHSPPFARLWLVGRNSETGSGRHRDWWCVMSEGRDLRVSMNGIEQMRFLFASWFFGDWLIALPFRIGRSPEWWLDGWV